MQEANRLKRLPLYLFTIIDNLKEKAINKGVDVIDLGMGSPDLPTPKHVVDELCKQAKVPGNQRYSRPNGKTEMTFKRAIEVNQLSKVTRRGIIDFYNALTENRIISASDITNSNYEYLEFERMSQQGTNDAYSIRERTRIFSEYLGIS